VEGHVADTPGGPDVAQRLSDQRAAVVAEALVAAGVPAERITMRGVGAMRPLATPEESRRVEITIG
jgi:outer membrane protein OmpA-like peptidoglycan-associated protein